MKFEDLRRSADELKKFHFKNEAQVECVATCSPEDHLKTVNDVRLYLVLFMQKRIRTF